jgi:phytoene synthase
MSQAASENFTVASRLLPAGIRSDLLAVYGFARLVDDLGDEATGDRLAGLDWAEDELDRAFAGRAEHPVFRALTPVIAGAGLPRAPFADLIEANRQDQRVKRYAAYEDLAAYCALSANPVGRLVLRVLGASTSANEELSDSICTGLQLVEHWQDVAEDAAAGRIYLPLEDLSRFGLSERDVLDPPPGPPPPAFRRLMAFEVGRARSLIESGLPLVEALGGRARLAIAGYAGGGLAQLTAIEDSSYDVLNGSPKATKAAVAAATLRLLRRAAGAGPAGAAAAAYERCEEITRAEARNFFFGIRLLPPAKRRAMAAIYALARRIDDIGDGEAPVEEKLAGLAAVRRAVEDLDHPGDDPVLVALADAVRRFPIPVAAFGELIDGCEMDCRATCYATIDELFVYCRRVAGSIGRLSLGVFGTNRPGTAEPLADTLGIALQLTNILRDVSEDRVVMGRVYLPSDDLSRFGCAPDASGPAAPMAELIRFEAGRAAALYKEGLGLLPMLDHRSRACVATMAGIYRRLLDRIEEDPAAAFDHRVSLPAPEKVWVAARSLAAAGS